MVFMFTNEREGQIKFFDNYRIPYNNDNSILVDNTDGVYHGNILEFKLNINRLNRYIGDMLIYSTLMMSI